MSSYVISTRCGTVAVLYPCSSTLRNQPLSMPDSQDSQEITRVRARCQPARFVWQSTSVRVGTIRACSVQEESLGFAPDELDLAHLDQTQTVSAPFPCQTRGSKPSHAGSDNPSLLPRALPQEAVPQQLTHLDNQGRAQMVDVGQVPVIQISCLLNIASGWTPSCSFSLTCASAEDSNC